MNTGIQRSSTTPIGATTSTTPVGVAGRGKNTQAKNLPLIMAMHNIPYTATATLSHMDDLAKKMQKAMEKKKEGLVYLHIFCPCPVGWGIESDMSIQVCREAVKTNYFPLWEAENGKFKLTQTVSSPDPITKYTKMFKKFNHLTEKELAVIQAEVDHNFAFLKHLTEFGAHGQPAESPENNA